jgi:hypothetical protein
VGRHSALDGVEAHPIVAAALAQRPADAPVGRHGGLHAEGTESGLGWPGTSTTHEGLGWPGGTSSDAGQAAPVAEPAAEAPQRRRRWRGGWRRLFRAA